MCACCAAAASYHPTLPLLLITMFHCHASHYFTSGCRRVRQRPGVDHVRHQAGQAEVHSLHLPLALTPCIRIDLMCWPEQVQRLAHRREDGELQGVMPPCGSGCACVCMLHRAHLLSLLWRCCELNPATVHHLTPHITLHTSHVTQHASTPCNTYTAYCCLSQAASLPPCMRGVQQRMRLAERTLRQRDGPTGSHVATTTRSLGVDRLRYIFLSTKKQYKIQKLSVYYY